jgi:hypothetical protein
MSAGGRSQFFFQQLHHILKLSRIFLTGSGEDFVRFENFLTARAGV